MRKDCWIETNIFMKPEKHKYYATFIKPLIKGIKRNFEVKSWHFFLEPNYEIRLRFLTSTKDSENLKEVLRIVLENKDYSDYVNYAIFTDYDGEAEKFGKQVWTTAYKIFEANSEWALAYNDPSVKKGKYFKLAPFNHYFLNVNNFNAQQEINAHAYMITERNSMLSQIWKS